MLLPSKFTVIGFRSMVIVKRWEEYTGLQAVRQEDGVKFAELTTSAGDAPVPEAPAAQGA